MSWYAGHWGPVVIAALAATLTAAAGGIATRLGPWYRELRKPSWQPPEWLFGPAWTTIFALIAAAGVLGWEAAPPGAAGTLLILFAVNAGLNIAWSVLFFTLRRPDWALVEVVLLWLSILSIIVAMQAYAAAASLLLLPYLLWVAFAAYLNLTIVRLNAPFRGGAMKPPQEAR